MKIFFIIIFLFVMGIGIPALAVDRCVEYIPDVRAQSIKNFGLSYPHWYLIGQLRQESCCRGDAKAWDGGQGIAQFMPRTTRYVNSLMKANLNPYNPQQAIRMQAFYMAYIHRKENWDRLLFLDFQIYNGGRGTLYKEYQRAGSSNWILMKAQCQRAKNFCEINYDYSQKVFKYGRVYKRGSDGPWMFW